MRAQRQQHMGISITNPEIEKELHGLKAQLQEAHPDRLVGQQMVVDYLLQNLARDIGGGRELDPTQFHPRLKKAFVRRNG